MKIFLFSLRETAELTIQPGAVMFVSLFGIEVLMQIGFDNSSQHVIPDRGSNLGLDFFKG
jgi:hypothetical protein